MKYIDCYKILGAKMMKRGFVCLFGYIVLFSIVSFCFSIKGYGVEETKMIENFKRANPLFISGEEYFVKEKYEKSRKKLEKCIEIMPEYADAWMLLAQIESKDSNLEKAMEDIQKAKLNYKLTAQFQAYSHDQYLNNLRNQKTKAEERIFLIEDKLSEQGSKLNKQQAQMEINEIKRNIERIDKEIRTPEVKTIDIPAEYFFVHGNILFKQRQFSEARDQYLEVIQREPTHVNANNNLINLYFIAGNHQKAIDCLNQAEANGVSINQKLKDAVLAAQKK